MQECGSQIRASLEEEGALMYAQIGDRVVLLDKKTGELSLWAVDEEADYLVEIGGIGYKYVGVVDPDDVSKLILGTITGLI